MRNDDGIFFLYLGSCCLLDDSTHTGVLAEVIPYLSKGLLCQLQLLLGKRPLHLNTQLI